MTTKLKTLELHHEQEKKEWATKAQKMQEERLQLRTLLKDTKEEAEKAK